MLKLASRFDAAGRNTNMIIVPWPRYIGITTHAFRRRCRVNKKHTNLVYVHNHEAMRTAIDEVSTCCGICQPKPKFTEEIPSDNG